MDSPVFEEIAERGVVPVVAADTVAAALPLADALISGGLPVIEITFRTAAAAEIISVLAGERPQVLVGAGTVLTVEQLERAKDCGAQFAVAPGFNSAVVARAEAIRLPFVPGVATPSDIEDALASGCRQLKFFPAEALGGVNMIKALAGPYAHTGARLVPTGGVNKQNLADYLSAPMVNAVGGTWIAKREAIEAGEWQDISQRCRAAVAIVERLKKA